VADALEIFWRKGLHATSMLDLAAATGVQRGSLYNAYHDKEELFLLAFDRYAARFLAAARAALEPSHPKRALHAFSDVAIANMTSGSPSRGCLTTKTATEADLIGKRVRRRLQRLLDELESVIADALSRKAALRRLALPPREAAAVIVTFTRGLAVLE